MVEMYSGLPEGVWICLTEEAAMALAANQAEKVGGEYEDGYWQRGDTEWHVREADLDLDVLSPANRQRPGQWIRCRECGGGWNVDDRPHDHSEDKPEGMLAPPRGDY